MNTSYLRQALIILGAAISVALCGGMGKREFPDPPPVILIDPSGRQWIITQAGGKSWFIADRIAVINFDKRRFSGKGPCNSFRGQRDGEGLSPFIASTKASCDKIEDEYTILEALGNIRTMQFNECAGVGLDEDEKIAVSFVRDNPAIECP